MQHIECARGVPLSVLQGAHDNPVRGAAPLSDVLPVRLTLTLPLLLLLQQLLLLPLYYYY